MLKLPSFLLFIHLLEINHIHVETDTLPTIGPPEIVFPDGTAVPDLTIIVQVYVVFVIVDHV